MANLTVIVENRVPMGKDLIAEHGFSAWLETPDGAVLWDAGQGYALPQNAPRLGVDWKKLRAIALSHGHFDHTGGLAAALQLSGGAEVVCAPACFTPKFIRRDFFGKVIEVPIGMPSARAEYEGRGARFEEAGDLREVLPGVFFFTGIPMRTEFESIEPGFFIPAQAGLQADPFADDAALAVKTGRGVSVILGCAHRGMINTLRHIQSRLDAPLYSVWGGTHLLERGPEQVQATVAALLELDVKMVGAAHCTGIDRELELAHGLGERFRFAHVGARAEL